MEKIDGNQKSRKRRESYWALTVLIQTKEMDQEIIEYDGRVYTPNTFPELDLRKICSNACEDLVNVIVCQTVIDEYDRWWLWNYVPQLRRYIKK